MEGFAEWTFEGSFETEGIRQVGADGYHNRYLVAYMFVCDLSGL